MHRIPDLPPLAAQSEDERCYNRFSNRSLLEDDAMPLIVEAIYENGVLKPAQPLPFKEQERVTISVEPAGPSLAERIAARAAALPREVLDRLPADRAAQHDHYIYGTPKRPE
jgi:predicted DNA-binding antitoxin AbrB/MazE fold protein